MEWSAERQPDLRVSYHHVKADTPIGIALITWKPWKTPVLYEVTIADGFVGTATSLFNAKEMARHQLILIAKQLNQFLDNGQKRSTRLT